MSASENSADIHKYGSAVDKARVRCSYCGKVVQYFIRLKYHLAGKRKYGKSCPLVPPNIRELFKNEIEKKNTGKVDQVEKTNGHPGSSRKRYCSPRKNTSDSVDQTSVLGSKKRGKVECLSVIRSEGSISCPDSNDVVPRGDGGSSPKELQKSIVRFFCETNLDSSAANSHSFKKMIESALRHGQLQYEVPNFQDLKQCLFPDSLEEMNQYVKEVRNSWAITGCSILLDGWKDSKGRDLVNVLVDCPSGVIYLRSVNLSSIGEDVNSVEGLLEEILDDVGLDNVVQIITDSTPACMQEVGKQLSKKHRTWFWTVCTSRCLEITLDKFLMLNSFRDTLEKAKTISRFIYSHADVLKLLGDRVCLTNLFQPSNIRSITTFCTLENIFCEQTDLQSFFSSSDWNTSNLASTEDGRRVTGLVSDENFFMTVDIMLKSAIPLVRILEKFNSENIPQLGNVYEIMDQVKEAIRKGFKGNKYRYKPFWNIIDEIWDDYSYTPLHSAGYFLNSRLFYCEDFHLDPEVTTGLLHCVCRIGGSNNTLDLAVAQIDEYRMAKGKFFPGSSGEDLSNLSPGNWWLKYGGHCPELQQLAVKILSQTCIGGSKYDLNKTPAEMIFDRGTNPLEQQRFSEQAFVYYNMHLQDFALNVGNDLSGSVLDPSNDWITGKSLLSVPEPENATVIDDGCLSDLSI